MATEIVTYGFAPGPITTKDKEPAPEPKPVPAVQIIQQNPNADKIIFMLGAVIIVLAIVIMLQSLVRLRARSA